MAYESSQDVSALRDLVNPAELRLGFPCSVRYDIHRPENSIVVAENWSGLREHGTVGSHAADASGTNPAMRHRPADATARTHHLNWTSMHVHGANTRATQKVLRLSLIATLAYVLLTLFAGLRAHSLALISEAGHNASDALALVLSFVAVWFQTRPATDRKTYGYQRAGVLAAFLNALALIVISGWIAFEAIRRLNHPTPGPARHHDVRGGRRGADERHHCGVCCGASAMT